ncbi:MAG: Na(+)-translocating NADH-quinone reductase subunit A [Phocaeicola sp.]|nr:Na(+)-translocating NADH-quinone reductase subunit A [Phocaeicola sp.]MDY5938760.1 Na(+)-translocating NADH-quinone reductase subunit A [Phocaeicola sp.]
MSTVIKLRKGLDINLQGKAKPEVLYVKTPEMYAIFPEDFTGITPKVMVKEQEAVKGGDVLFVDKNHPELKIVSPVSGTITAVVRGERRKVLYISIKPDANQTNVDFGMTKVDSLNATTAKELLLKTGLFAFIKQRPYDVVADPTIAPRDIFITGFDSAPLAPDFELALKGEEEYFQLGLTLLSKIATTHLSISAKQTSPALTTAKNVTVHIFDGPHPAGNTGVQINHIAPVNKGETVWTLNAETVLFIGRVVATGVVDQTRLVAVVGSEVKNPAYCKLKAGAQITPALENQVNKQTSLRYISGNPLTGKRIDADGFLGAFHGQITVIPEGDDNHEMFGWIMPRLNQFSTSHSYFSWLLGKKEYALDARIKGGERHMIMSAEYDNVLPMDILSEYLIKAIIAGDIDRMEKLGIYEVAPEDFALCEFVCSSKMELQRIVRNGLDMLRKEMC